MLTLIIVCSLSMPGVEPAAIVDVNPELEAYLLEAAENNPGLAGHHAEWRAAMERIPQITSLDDPMFTYAPFLKSDTNNVQFSLAQKFPWFGSLKAQGDSGAAEADAALERFYAARNAVFATVKRAYFEYAFLTASIAVTNAQLDLLRSTEEIVRSKYSLGVASEGDLLRVQIEQTTAEHRKDSLDRERALRSAVLSEAIGRSTAEILPAPKESPLPGPVPPVDTMLAQVRQANPELVAFNHLVESGKQQEKLSRKRGLPNVTVGLMYTERSHIGGENFVMPSVSVNLPIWRRRIKAGIEEAKLRTEAARHQRRGRALALESAAQSVLFGMEDALRRFHLYEDSLLPKAQQSFQSLQNAYASGAADANFLDVLDSVRFLLNFQLDQLRAKRDAHVAAAELENLVGGHGTPGEDPVTATN